MFFGLNSPEIFIIMVIVLTILGPKRIEKALYAFKRLMKFLLSKEELNSVFEEKLKEEKPVLEKVKAKEEKPKEEEPGLDKVKTEDAYEKEKASPKKQPIKISRKRKVIKKD